MKRIYVTAAISFLVGYAANDFVQAFSLGAQPAHAEVAGMGYSDLKNDSDFKKAVRRTVENYCTVYEESLSC